MLRPRSWLLLLLVPACVGAPAPDAPLCRDLITRLCTSPRCPGVDAQFSVTDSCEDTLLTRSGCVDDGFAFSMPTRAQWLECRAIVVRSGIGADVKPRCEDVSQMLGQCPEVVTLLKGPPR